MRAAMLVCGFVFLVSVGFGQQIAISRVEQMPNKPSPYLMRNWKEVAWGFDSLAFDFSRTGQYLPLGGMNNATVNYPSHPSFRLHTVVGTTDPFSAEAITCLPAVIGASLGGIDKSDQQGTNWVLMCEEWFNKKNGTNLYLNHPDAVTGDDWWYETMPNVFFFQLYSLYPSTGDFRNQFKSIADGWLGAARGMGGSTTPWNVPNMNHRAWNFGTKSPNDIGVKEPEAAGAIAWLLYQAYIESGQKQYREGAELAMEFLNGWSTNPSYEIQMPYGAYITARMNAELGTEYDIGKMLNWCFDIGPLRSWGAMVGNWGGYDCSGLIGEIYVNEYAFTMNTFETVGALVPLVRYDDRFARAIGKWVLNAANAARLFYPNYLPDANQDSEEWARPYDSSSVIAHEAMRQYNGGTSPYATGDAISGNWGATNLALYASSHVGILGGIIDTTNVPGILRLDVLKTDYFHEQAYPTFLYFNPDSVPQDVTINVGTEMRDLYDAVTNAFLVTSVTDSADFTIPANSAVVIVVTPTGGTVSYDLDKTLVDGIVVDYRSGLTVANYPPRIKSLAAESSLVLTNTSIQVYCTAADRNNDSLAYSWNATSGTISGSDAQITWTSPDTSCTALIFCEVSDGNGGQVRDTVTVQVVYFINHPPRIQKLQAVPRKIDLQSSSMISCTASDPDTDAVSFTWFSSAGSISGSGSTVTWMSPSTEGDYFIVCRVEDGLGGSMTDSVGLEVRDFSKFGSGQLVAFYPFNGNANDASGNQHHGVVSSTVPVTDRFGQAASAYAFDGVTSSVRIANDTALNFQSAITINFWMKIGAYYPAREQYVISHGNWQNRWKISVTPLSNKLRWTVKTSTGTNAKDLDSETSLVLDSLYNVTALYSGADMEIYLNRALDAFTLWSGPILQTSIDLTVGQVLPSENSYNFNGVLDDIRIYDFALAPSQISALYDIGTSITDKSNEMKPTRFELAQNFPNPFNPSTTIVFSVPTSSNVRIAVYDVLGRSVITLLQGEMEPGRYSVTWNAGESASGVYFCVLQAGSVQAVRPMHLIR
ncbi:MAG: T9SS type A sorting domain-containing protein [Ignavibacteriales bacterium]|nr:T9SS type A sorting domain-containing protein [Ignavibacteriales bacterium]